MAVNVHQRHTFRLLHSLLLLTWLVSPALCIWSPKGGPKGGPKRPGNPGGPDTPTAPIFGPPTDNIQLITEAISTFTRVISIPKTSRSTSTSSVATTRAVNNSPETSSIESSVPVITSATLTHSTPSAAAAAAASTTTTTESGNEAVIGSGGPPEFAVNSVVVGLLGVVWMVVMVFV
ncbi:hypothetical protein VTJ04DRAFT_9751 [Mycothermus thermophilus]|uniref:uncharacterized protein n=1 Tax=Humicola insolens TaxID=85995 RepID=UPI003743452B